MKKLLMLLLMVFGVNSSTYASDWTEADTVRQGVVLTTFALDYAQTKDIKNHPGMYETNSLMGAHPSDARIRNYFVAASVVHTAIMYNVRPEWRRNLQYATIALEVAVILRNKRIGLHYQF